MWPAQLVNQIDFLHLFSKICVEITAESYVAVNE